MTDSNVKPSIEELRKRFEAELVRTASGAAMLASGRLPSGNYANPMVTEGWLGFQLGYAASMEDAAVACDEQAQRHAKSEPVQVPVELVAQWYSEACKMYELHDHDDLATQYVANKSAQWALGRK